MKMRIHLSNTKKLFDKPDHYNSLGSLSAYTINNKNVLRYMRAFRVVFSYLFFSFSVVWTAVTFFSTYSDYVHLRNSLQNGQFDFLEGPVTQFIPMPYEGHTYEGFVVDGKRFEYSDYNVSNGFNNTSSHGGPIREGIKVRVWSVNGRGGHSKWGQAGSIIVKLAIANP